ncbi:hypothetical protein [Ectobacillus ponti]|uniref:Uncharacterized protein n=1 Tax=Ectobacillus ponti TaxID=2961894 RepID=A0AA42BQ56_9BACI|nr:hypothetical protein [Ectobacillus ponti]MCP8968079.1 hypothetical protein [Ectobacillus ponti]
MAEEKVQRQATEHVGSYEVKLEGLEDGYRVTFKTDKEAVKTQRRVGASFINFLRQAEKAGWYIPAPFRLLLKFWGRYNQKMS